MTATLAPTTAAPAPKRPAWRHFERHAWFFMRVSGVLLLFLALGHMLIMLTWVPGGGVHRVNAAFLAQRWHQPFWKGWDLVMLWLAELHGSNGVRVVIDDYARKPATRAVLRTLLALSAILTLAAGSYALLGFRW